MTVQSSKRSLSHFGHSFAFAVTPLLGGVGIRRTNPAGGQPERSRGVLLRQLLLDPRPKRLTHSKAHLEPVPADPVLR